MNGKLSPVGLQTESLTSYYGLTQDIAKSFRCCVNGKLSLEGLQTESLTSYYGLTQVINESTHLLSNSSSCNDPKFTTQANLVTHSGAYSSFHKNFHQQITFAKFDFHILCSTTYKRLVWNYMKVGTLFIQPTINELNWENVFSNI